MKTFLQTSLLIILSIAYSHAQIICIYCYNQNDSISTGVNNLLTNGGFENGCTNGSFCPNSSYYTCDIPGWTCTGGGSSTYVQVFDSSGAWYGSFLSEIIQGKKAVYLGDFYCNACSTVTGDTSCLVGADCTVMTLPAGYPNNTTSYGVNGVSIEQSVSGLTVGNTYVLEFWAGGEYDPFDANGVFAVDVGSGDTLLRCRPTNLGDIGIVYVIEFNATSPTQIIKFTNWGHICYSCTEVVLDNVRLYTLAELSPNVPSCGGVTSSNDFSASDTSLCQKFCTDFTDLSTNNPTSWQWSFPGGNPSSSTDQNPTSICYNTPGTYNVTLITTNSFGSDTLTLSNYITVHPTPSFPSITQNGNTLTCSPAFAYQWQLNSIDIPGATQQSYTYTLSGLYTVLAFDANGCSNYSSIEVTGTSDITADFTVSVFPNPSSGKLTVQLIQPVVLNNHIHLQFENTLGQTMLSFEENNSASFVKEIDVHDLPAAVYSLEIISGDKSVREKIMITH